jgi:hypothetical protein
MSEQAAKLFAGQMGICAVLINILIDKGLITASEMQDRFEQAREAANRCSGGAAVAHALAEIVAYLEPRRARSEKGGEGPLEGALVLVLAHDTPPARHLQRALEDAGAEVLRAYSRAEATLRIEQFDLAAAALEWRFVKSQRSLARRLNRRSVPFLVFGGAAVEEGSRVVPVFAASTPPDELVEAVARLVREGGKKSLLPVLVN